MITTRDSFGDEVCAERDDADTGWLVYLSDGENRWYPDTGGAWTVDRHGGLRQCVGTLDAKAPRSAAAMRRFLAKL